MLFVGLFVFLSGEALLYHASPFVSIALTTVLKGILSYPVTPSYSQPASQHTAVEEPPSLSLSDMPEQH